MSPLPPPNYTQAPNVLLDELLPDIDSLSELKVTLVVVRATIGWHEHEVRLTYAELQRRTGLSRDGVARGVSRALDRGTLERRVEGPAGHQETFYTLNIGGQESRLQGVNGSLDARPQGDSVRSGIQTAGSQDARPPLGTRTQEAQKETDERKERLESSTTSQTQASSGPVADAPGPDHGAVEEENGSSNSTAAGAPVELAKRRDRAEKRQLVFDRWVWSKGPRSSGNVLDAARRRRIDWALDHYPIEDVLDAVVGWRQIPHNRGENDRNRPFNDIKLLLKDADNLERFRDAERAARRKGDRLAPGAGGVDAETERKLREADL